jgi:hypothetical protein
MQKQIINFNFEGYEFELLVEYIGSSVGIIIDNVTTTNILTKNINNQEYTHILHVLRYDLLTGKHRKTIKRILIQELKFRDKQKRDISIIFTPLFIAVCIIAVIIFVSSHE